MRTVYSQSNPPPKRKIDASHDGRTKQNFKDECDINSIVARALRAGMLPQGKLNPVFSDFSEVKSYQEGLDVVIRAQNQFNALPAHVRKRFHGDPAEFLEFATDPKNTKEMVELGLATWKGQPPVNDGLGQETPSPASSNSSPGGDKGAAGGVAAPSGGGKSA